MQKYGFSACLEHSGRPGVDHVVGPHGHRQLELGHPTPPGQGMQLPVCHKPRHFLPPSPSLVPNLLTRSPASNAAREGKLARLKTGQRSRCPPRALGSKAPSTSCSSRGLFCYFSFVSRTVPAHPMPMMHIHPQRRTRLSSGVGVRPKLYTDKNGQDRDS